MNPIEVMLIIIEIMLIIMLGMILMISYLMLEGLLKARQEPKGKEEQGSGEMQAICTDREK